MRLASSSALNLNPFPPNPLPCRFTCTQGYARKQASNVYAAIFVWLSVCVCGDKTKEPPIIAYYSRQTREERNTGNDTHTHVHAIQSYIHTPIHANEDTGVNDINVPQFPPSSSFRILPPSFPTPPAAAKEDNKERSECSMSSYIHKEEEKREKFKEKISKKSCKRNRERQGERQ